MSIKTCVILLGNIIGIGPICKHLRIFLSLKTVIPDWAQTSPAEKRSEGSRSWEEGSQTGPLAPYLCTILASTSALGAMPSEPVFTIPPLLSDSLVFLWNLVFSKAGNGISSQEGDLSDLDTQYRGLSYR